MHKKLSTLHDVAAKAGVSRQTVSRYINGGALVSARTAEKIQRAIQALGYHPSAAARTLRSRRTMNIGLALYNARDLIPELSELFALKLSGVFEVLGPRGYGLQVLETDPAAALAGSGTHYAHRVRGGEIDGLIVSDFHLPVSELELMREAGFPFVMIDRFCPEFPGRCAVTDVFLEGFRLTTALLERGHRRLAYCGWPPGRGLAHRFRDGMVRAIEEAACDAEIVADIHPAKGGTYANMEHLSRILGARNAPTAAVCNDDWLTGLVALLAERGVPAAPNFQLAGVSLRPDYFDAARVVLVATPMDRELGIAGAELLLDLIAGAPERHEPVNVGAARFVSPSFPYLVHPQTHAP